MVKIAKNEQILSLNLKIQSKYLVVTPKNSNFALLKDV